MLTLAQILEATNDSIRRLDTGAVQVFYHFTKPYYDCSDYAVSSAVSGPSLIMVPRSIELHATKRLAEQMHETLDMTHKHFDNY